MVHGVTARAPHADPRQHFPILLDELHASRIQQRHVVLGEVARAIALVRVGRVLPLAATDEVPGIRKARRDAVAIPRRESTGVIEVQMRRQHDVDVLRREPGVGERVVEVTRPIEPVDVGGLRAELVADARVDQHGRSAGSYDERPHAHHNAVPVVRLRALAPHRPRE